MFYLFRLSTYIIMLFLCTFIHDVITKFNENILNDNKIYPISALLIFFDIYVNVTINYMLYQIDMSKHTV